MTPLALLLVTGSALGWAALDALRKQIGRSMSATAAVVMLNVGLAPLFGAWAAIEGPELALAGYAGPGAVLLVINCLANVLFVQAVTVSPLSLTVPFLALTPAFTALLGIPLLGEQPGLVDSLGIALVVLGAMALNATREDGFDPRRLVGALVRERGSALMVAVAALWSGAVVLDKVALGHASVPVHAAVQAGGVALALLGWLLLRGRAGELGAARQCPGWLVAGVLASVVALGFQLFALQMTFASFLEAVKRVVGLTAALLVGRLFFAEPLNVRKVASVGAMAAGAALVILS